MEPACDTFYGFHKCCGRSNRTDSVLEQLDDHTIYHPPRHLRNKTSGTDQRMGETTGRNASRPVATIELSLTSPISRGLDSDTGGLLGVIAYFPRGVGEKNINWLSPTVSDGLDILCILSLVLVYRNDRMLTQTPLTSGMPVPTFLATNNVRAGTEDREITGWPPLQTATLVRVTAVFPFGQKLHGKNKASDESGDDRKVAQTSWRLSDSNWMLHSLEEGTEQAEVLEIYE